MSIEYIRKTYKVPAKVGGKIIFEGHPGIITGTNGPHLRIRLDDEKRSGYYHPTWNIEYLEKGK